MPEDCIELSGTLGSSFSCMTYSHETMVAILAKNARDVSTIASHVRHDPPQVLELQIEFSGE